MLECSAKDILEAFKKAPNINAAVKNFLKKEAKKGEPSEKFAKSLRTILESKNEAISQKFIEESIPHFLNYHYSIACYAYYDFIGKLAQEIVVKYADEFNATFEIVDEKLKYKDQAKFKSISNEALKIIDQDLKDIGFENSPFMKNVALISVFERPVIEVLS